MDIEHRAIITARSLSLLQNFDSAFSNCSHVLPGEHFFSSACCLWSLPRKSAFLLYTVSLSKPPLNLCHRSPAKEASIQSATRASAFYYSCFSTDRLVGGPVSFPSLFANWIFRTRSSSRLLFFFFFFFPRKVSRHFRESDTAAAACSNFN